MSKHDELEQVRKRILDEMQCPLKDAATNLVFGKGNPSAPILFIGEAPGEKEDLQGIPFVGSAGKELDKALRKIELTLEDVYVANILKYRPPNNRDPTEEEIRRHTPYLIEQIKIIQPTVICTLGNFSTKFVLAGCDVDGMKKIAGVAQLHGTPTHVTLDGRECTVVPLYHPAAMLYRPALRKDFDEDFVKLGALLGKGPQKKTLADY
jgi:uracil-DNA glycosylase